MKTKLTTIFKKSANTPPMWVCLLFAWLLLPFNAFAVGVTSTPVTNDFSASYDGAKVNLSWNNSNKLNLVPSDVSNNNIKNGDITSGCSINSLSVSAQGVISASYTLDAEWHHVEFEMVMPGGEKSGVQSLVWDYSSKPSNVNVYPYFMTNNDWYVWAEKNNGNYVGPTLDSEQGFVTTPNDPFAVWFHKYTSSPFVGNNIHLIGFYVEAGGGHSNINDDIQISNVYVNTSINWDALKIVRKIGGVPSSISDGTVIDIAAGSANSYTDNSISDGNSYYYAVFAEINSVWTKIAESSEVVVGSLKDNVDLSLNQTEVTIPVGGLFTLTHTTADGYDGSISYSVAPAGVINFNESTGVITGIQMGGSATITVTASETSNFIGDTETCTVHVVKNFAGELTGEENAGVITLNWFYNLPISLATTGSWINYGGGSSSASYEDGIRTITYTHSGGTAYSAPDFKTPLGINKGTANCKSFSFEYRGDNTDKNARIVPYSYVTTGSGDIVAAPVTIGEEWQPATVTPAYYYSPSSTNIQGSAINYQYYANPSECVAFFPMADEAVTNGTLQLRNAYYQIINTNGLTSAVALVRKKGAIPANATDGDVIYTSAATTYVDEASLDQGSTYYYRLFATYNGYTYVSNEYAVTIPGTEDPELAISETSKLLIHEDTYTIPEPTIAAGYSGTLEYTVTPASGVINFNSATREITTTGKGTAIIRITAPAEGAYYSSYVEYTVKVLSPAPLNIPDVDARLDHSNTYETNATTTTFDSEACLDFEAIGNSGYADWYAYITPEKYDVTFKYGVPAYGLDITLSLYDPVNMSTPVKTYNKRIDSAPEKKRTDKIFWDLSGLSDSKYYIVRVKNNWTGSQLRVGYIDFALHTPLVVGSQITLDASNASTLPGTDNFDLNNDETIEECIDLSGKATAEWDVKLTPDYYDIELEYGTPDGSVNVTLSIVNGSTAASTTLIHSEHSGAGNVTYKEELSKVDLTTLNANQNYLIRVVDTYGDATSKPKVGSIKLKRCAPKEIPDETHFDKDNAFSTVTTATDMDIDGEAGNDELINLDRKKVEWDVKVTPGVYNVSLVYGAPQYSIKVSVALIDPENPESVIYLSKDGNHTYYYKSGSQNTPHHYTSTARCDLTGIDGNKIYRLRISDEYDGSNYLRVKDLTFASVAPIAISNVTDTRLDATNTILPPTMATDLDIDDDSNVDNLMNLYNTNAEWQVTLNKGLYNVQLVYGAPGYSIKVAVRLIDPAGEESDRVMSIQGDKDYYDKSNPATTEEEKATTPHHYTSATKCALLDVTEDKIYKVRVADVYPKCNLRVSHVLFTPIAPVEIHEEATLNASNVMVAPSIVDSRIDIRNQQEAVWYATIDPHKFDITLTYFAEDGGTKVRFAIIPVGGDTIFVHQENKYDASNTTYTIPALDQDLTNISSGVYKIIVKDNYKSNGSKPQIISLTFSRSVTTDTRTGLTVGNYGTICLPYAVAAEDRNGADLFEIDKWDPNGASLTLSQLTVDENMVAGRPYIFQATAATATFRYYAEGDEAAAGSNNGLVGSYVQALIPQNDDNYIIYNNKLYLVNSEAYVGANRAYIHKQDQVQPAPAYRRRVTLSVNGAQVATDIDLINDPAQMTKYIENGHLFIFRDGKLYNAQGQLVK